MRPTIDELHNSGRYELIDTFRIDEMNQFLLRELGADPAKKARQPTQKKWVRWIFLLLFAIVGGAVGYLVGFVFGSAVGKPDNAQSGGPEHLSALWQLGLAFVGFFILLPIHELIHAAVFKYYGAPKVGFGGSKKSLIVYAYAQRFVHSSRELVWIAIMPFLVITTALIAAWIMWPQYAVIWGISLFIHTTACVGDFVLINYHFKNRNRNVYTYDDIEQEYRSYFFAQRESS